MKFQLSKYRNRVNAFLGMALLTLGMGSANAIVITLAGGPTTIGFFSTGNGYKLVVDGSFDLTALTATSATLRVVLHNASTLTGGGAIANTNDVRLASFGFGINPNATAVAFSDPQGADGGMVNATLDNIPNLSQIEVCAFGGNNCSGGSNGGILVGASDTFDLILSGNFADLTSLTFDPLGVKFQTPGSSFEFTGGGGTPQGFVPEPSSIALFGAGLLGFAAFRRKMAADKQ